MGRIEIAWSVGVIGLALALAGGMFAGVVTPVVLVAGAGALFTIYVARFINPIFRMLGFSSTAIRICPQCGREVPTGHVACGPCGYSFIQSPAQRMPMDSGRNSWPASPVKLSAAEPLGDANGSHSHSWPDPAMKLRPNRTEAHAEPAPQPTDPPHETLLKRPSGIVRRYCTRCGAQVKASNTFCGDCGHKLSARTFPGPSSHKGIS